MTAADPVPHQRGCLCGCQQDLCFKCHVLVHSLQGDWRMWGHRGGLAVQEKYPHVRLNLKQYSAEGRKRVSLGATESADPHSGISEQPLTP